MPTLPLESILTASIIPLVVPTKSAKSVAADDPPSNAYIPANSSPELPKEIPPIILLFELAPPLNPNLSPRFKAVVVVNEVTAEPSCPTAG